MRPRRARQTRRLPAGIYLDVAALAILLVIAALVRADDFMVVPRLADETLEVRLGLQLAREGGLPLVGYAPHIGSLFTYLVAGVFLLIGPKIEAGRLLVLTTGVLTIIPTYLLGRDLGMSLGGSVAGESEDRNRGASGSAPGTSVTAAGVTAASVAGASVTRGRLVGLIAALLLALSGPHIATSSRIAYSNSLTPLFTMTGLWLAHRALSRRSNAALIGAGSAFGLALQTSVSTLSLGPGVLAAFLLPAVIGAVRDGLSTVWPRPRIVIVTAGAGLLMIGNLIVYNLIVGPATVNTAGNQIGRYVGEDAWTPDAWGDRLLALLQAAALAVGNQTSEYDATADALLSPFVILSVALALLGLWVAARRGAWLPLLVTVSVLLFVSLLNARVEPIVPRVRHYVTLVPLGMVTIALALVWLREWASRWSYGAWFGTVGLVVVPLVLVAGSMASLSAYEAERLSRPDKNNAAYLAVLDAVAASGEPTERLYMDDQLNDLLTLSGGRMLTHLRYAFDVTGQEFDTIEVDDDRLPVGNRGVASRRLILHAETIPLATAKYRLVPLPGEPGEGSPLRAFRAFPLRER